jgi:hypothetical protein
MLPNEKPRRIIALMLTLLVAGLMLAAWWGWLHASQPVELSSASRKELALREAVATRMQTLLRKANAAAQNGDNLSAGFEFIAVAALEEMIPPPYQTNKSGNPSETERAALMHLTLAHRESGYREFLATKYPTWHAPVAAQSHIAPPMGAH